MLFSGDVITRLDPRGEVLGQTFARAGNVGVVAIGPGGGFVLSAGNEYEPFISSLLHFNPAGALVHRVFLGETPPFVPSRIALAANGHVLAVAITTQTGIVRLLADGSADPSFGTDGLLPIPVRTRKVVVASDDAVTFATWDTPQGPQLTRVTPSGAIDPSFGDGGHAVVASSSYH